MSVKPLGSAEHPVKVAVLAPSFPPAFRGGGPARTLDALTQATPLSHRSYVFAPDRDTGEVGRLPVSSNEWSAERGVPVFYASVDSAHGLIRMYREVRRLRPDAVYLNSFFNLKFSIVPQMLIAAGFWGRTSLLVAPRGEFDPGALAIRSRKKNLFLWAHRLLLLQRKIMWHASSEIEAKAIGRIWRDEAKILVRENETSLPMEALEPHKHDGAFRAVFLSRLVPKKGLLTALRAISRVRSTMVFDVYGPAEDQRYIAECKNVVESLPDNIQVRFIGPVLPGEVRAIFSDYDAMIFPTKGENFGHVIAEALSASCPVITTDTTPWSPFLSEGGGYVVHPDEIGEWARVIERLAAQSPAQRSESRAAAGACYEKWRKQAGGPHVFELLAVSGR